MNLQMSIEVLRSKIAMFLHGTAGDAQARGLIQEAEELLFVAGREANDWQRRAERRKRGIEYWKQCAERAESLRDAEVDDGK